MFNVLYVFPNILQSILCDQTWSSLPVVGTGSQAEVEKGRMGQFPHLTHLGCCSYSENGRIGIKQLSSREHDNHTGEWYRVVKTKYIITHCDPSDNIPAADIFVQNTDDQCPCVHVVS